MKSIKAILMGSAALLAFSMSSCSDWLDVNVDPVNPTSESATYQNRLAHIEFYTNHGSQFAAWRTSMSMGDWTRYYNGSTYWHMSYWNPQQGAVTTPYQWFLVGAASNIQDMYDKAMAAGAFHYAGAAKALRAYGYMMIADVYGEMPYSSVASGDATPSYDTGRQIYLGCLADLDEAIELFQKDQAPTVASLAVGDWWNNGDANKWLKMCYLLKARWLNKLSKKAAGSYLEGKYDVATIEDCLSKAMQSNAENTVINHTDDNGTTTDVLGWSEPVDYSPLFSLCGMNGGYMVTKMLYDNLTNFGGYGVEDPRADKIIPWQVSPGNDCGAKYVNGWRRSFGVDMVSGNAPNLTAGPLRAGYNADKGGWWIDSDNADRLGDTVYVECTSYSKGYHAGRDLFYRRGGTSVDDSRESGSFYTRVSAPTYIATYAEACFIKAEILFNKGSKSEAFDAYKKGIQASIELMNDKLRVWCAEDENLKKCPSFTPMEQADIDNYLANGIGTAGDITLGKILTQKRIALHFSTEIWNDMRRYDFDESLFLGWGRPANWAKSAAAQKGIPAGKHFRRWRQCSHELNYNAENLHAIGAQVPGADMSLEQWNNADDVWTINVWWDSNQE